MGRNPGSASAGLYVGLSVNGKYSDWIVGSTTPVSGTIVAMEK